MPVLIALIKCRFICTKRIKTQVYVLFLTFLFDVLFILQYLYVWWKSSRSGFGARIWRYFAHLEDPFKLKVWLQLQVEREGLRWKKNGASCWISTFPPNLPKGKLIYYIWIKLYNRLSLKENETCLYSSAFTHGHQKVCLTKHFYCNNRDFSWTH